MARLHLAHGLEFFPGVEAELGDFFLDDLLPVEGVVGDGVPDVQGPAGELDIRQAVALGVAGDLEDAGGEVLPVGGGFGVGRQALQKFGHAVQVQGRAEEAGEELAQADEAGDVTGVYFPGVQVLVEQGILPHGDGLQPVLILLGEVETALVQMLAELGHERGPAWVGQVHFREEYKRRDLPLAQEPPERLRVGLHAVRCADDQDRVVQHLQGALHLGGEIHMAGGVQQRDGELLRFKQGLLGEDGDAAGAF